MSKTNTTTKAKTKKVPVTPRATKPTPPAKTIYRLCVTDEGRQMIGECCSADEAAKKAKALSEEAGRAGMGGHVHGRFPFPGDLAADGFRPSR